MPAPASGAPAPRAAGAQHSRPAGAPAAGAPAPPLLAIVGPTASGKTDLVLALAREVPIEIMVADSRQVYRHMDIGTAKPSAAARSRVPHHLLDLADPDELVTLADWLYRARALIPEIAARGRLPVVVGGTGLYVSALLDGYELDPGPPAAGLRRELLDELVAKGVAALASRLAHLDPELASRTDLRNPRRVLRSLERLSAHPGGATAPRATPYAGPVAIFGLARPRDELHRRIGRRAAALFATGLVEEARALLALGYTADLPALSGHGYREAIGYLAGEWSLDEAIAVTARRTRQYARRQLTWFRRDTRVRWMAAGVSAADRPELVAVTRDAALTLHAAMIDGKNDRPNAPDRPAHAGRARVPDRDRRPA